MVVLVSVSVVINIRQIWKPGELSGSTKPVKNKNVKVRGV